MSNASSIPEDALQENQASKVKSMRSTVAFVIAFWCGVCIFMCGMCCLLDSIDLTTRITQLFGV